MLVASSGWWLWSILFIILWIAIAFWPARVAARTGLTVDVAHERASFSGVGHASAAQARLSASGG
jgi:hypothetical protein